MPSPSVYERRRPEESTLYRVVQENLATLYGAVADGALAIALPRHTGTLLRIVGGAERSCRALPEVAAWSREQPVDRRRACAQDLGSDDVVEFQMAMAFERGHKHLEQRFEPLAAHPIGRLPKRDEGDAHRLVVHVPTTTYTRRLPMNFSEPETDLRGRLQRLGLFGLLASWKEVADKPWLHELLQFEEQERKRRSLDRRVRNARIGSHKPMADFDWGWPRKIDRTAIDDLFTLGFLDDGTNVILLGPNGVGKTMILRNLAHHTLVRGHTVKFTSASDMLAELAAQESSAALARRMRRFVAPKLLCIDEVGYLSYSARYADLLFDVISRRYEAQRSVLVSTNKAFNEWSEVFPHAACTVTLVDRLVHRSEIIEVDGDSFRLKEAKPRASEKASARKRKPPT